MDITRGRAAHQKTLADPPKSRPTPRASEATDRLTHTGRESHSPAAKKKKVQPNVGGGGGGGSGGVRLQETAETAKWLAGTSHTQFSQCAAMAMLLCAWWSNSGPGYRQVADRTPQKVPDGSTGEPAPVTTHNKQTDPAFSALIFLSLPHKNTNLESN